MRRVLKIIAAAFAVLVCVVIGLFWWSTDRDQRMFAAAKNDCERACIQDSGGLDQCRVDCKGHPDRFP